jgi:predicted anti-sigma-YlaC factor YlaD
MECHEVQELILESFERTSSSEPRVRIDAHVSTCDECSRFALVQKALDHRLSALLLPAPTFSQASRSALRARIRDEVAPVQVDALPEIVHFGSCAIATLVMAAVLPVSPSTVIGPGIALAVLSYLLLSAVRDTMDDVLGADA